jgi:hypothetical protein
VGRSFALNEELNAVVYYTTVIAHLEKVFAEDLMYSHKMSSSASYLPGPQLVSTFFAVVEGIGRKPNSGPCRRSGS